MKPISVKIIGFYLISIILASELPNSRKLSVIIDQVTSSKTCKNDCVDLSYNFCPTNSDFSTGTCCDDSQCQGSVGPCSNEATQLKEMQYQVCPKEQFCGTYEIQLSNEGEQEIKPSSPLLQFNSGALCTYKINFPEQSEQGQSISVIVDKLINIEGKFIATTSFSSGNYLKADLQDSGTYSIGYPNTVFLTLVSTSSQTSNFKLLAKSIPKSADSQIQSDKIDIVLPTSSQKDNNKSSKQQDNNKIYFISVAVIVVLGILVSVFCIQKKNDQLSTVKQLSTKEDQSRKVEIRAVQRGPQSRPNIDAEDSQEIEIYEQKKLFRDEDEKNQFQKIILTHEKKRNQKSNYHLESLQSQDLSVPGSITDKKYQANARSGHESQVQTQVDDFMGGNSIIAAARAEARNEGYFGNSSLTTMGKSTGLGLGNSFGGTKLPPAAVLSHSPPKKSKIKNIESSVRGSLDTNFADQDFQKLN